MQTLPDIGASTGTLRGGALARLPVPVIVQDLSVIEDFCATRRQAGAAALTSELAEPGVLSELLSGVRVVEVNQAAAEVCGVADPSALCGPFGADLMVLTSPDSFVEQVLAVFEQRDQLRTEVDSLDTSGRPVMLTLNWAPARPGSALDYSQTVCVFESGGSYENSEASGYTEQLQALIEIGGQLTAMLDPEVIFEKVLATIREVLDPSMLALFLLDIDRLSILGCAGDGVCGEVAPSYEQLISGLSGAAVRSGVALISDDISKEAGFGDAAKAVAADRPGWSQIAAPIISGERPIGVIEALFEPDRANPTPEAASFIATLAGQVAVAIRNAEMYAELAESHHALQSAHKQLQDTQTQLLSAQKMEAIGSLAAGIAHEINTPIQYVSDNVSFLLDSSDAVFGALREIESIVESTGSEEAIGRYRKALDDADMEFIQEEIPDAFAQTKEGVERVAAIVRAMKEFAHPGNDNKAPIDINRSVETTVEVAKNEWKYVADIDLRLDSDLPHVPALTGPFNQSLLILVVNAAQALGEEIDHGRMDKGQITISTGVEGDEAVIRVADNGPGISASIADQIFDPFFTTKDVGKGSGQGLSIAHSVIVERHGGTIYAEDTPGGGATFVIRLPLSS